MERKKIVKNLDKYFSLYIRSRYSKNGIAECYTCGTKKPIKELQCGHFMSRKHYSTRWDEDNCQVQCYACNVMRYGEQYKFGLRLNAEYGEDMAENLLIKSKQTVKFSNVELLEMIEKYKLLTKL